MKILLVSDDGSLSQMAKGVIETFDNNAIICSAVMVESGSVSLYASRVMQERGVDISNSLPRPIDDCVNESWGVVIMIGGNQNACRAKFVDNVRSWISVDFRNVSTLAGEEEDVVEEYRRVRDEMFKVLKHLYFDKIKYAGSVCSCGANDFCICH